MHIETFTLFKITDVSPLLAISLHLCFTLFFGWLQGFIIVKKWFSFFYSYTWWIILSSRIDRSLYRAFNKKPDQTAGSTTVTEIPDIKNIVNVPGHGELERDVAKSLPQEELIRIIKNST